MRRIREDIRAIKQNDPKKKNEFGSHFNLSRIHALWFHRVSHFYLIMALNY